MSVQKANLPVSLPVPKLFLDKNGDPAEDLHTHPKCGKSYPMEAYRNIGAGQDPFKCPGCDYSARAISVRPAGEFNNAKNEFYEKTVPAYLRLVNAYQELERRSETSIKIVKALKIYQLVKIDFNNGFYDKVVNGCIEGLRLHCENIVINDKLEKLLSKAHKQRVEKCQEERNELTNMHKTSWDKDNEKVIQLYNRLNVQSLNKLGLFHKEVADFYYEIDKLSEAEEEFDKAAKNFEQILALNLEKDIKIAVSMNLANIYRFLAKINYFKKEYTNALKYYEKSNQMYENILKLEDTEKDLSQIKKTINTSYLDMCDVYFKLSDSKKILEECEKLIEKVDEKYVEEELLRATRNLLCLKLSQFESDEEKSDTEIE